MVIDRGVPFNETRSTMVDHGRVTTVVRGRPWSTMVDHGPFRLGTSWRQTQCRRKLEIIYESRRGGSSRRDMWSRQRRETPGEVDLVVE